MGRYLQDDAVKILPTGRNSKIRHVKVAYQDERAITCRPEGCNGAFCACLKSFAAYSRSIFQKKSKYGKLCTP